MDAVLAAAGLAMGLAASPHCTVMCGAPCAALTRGCRRDAAGFHAGRLLGYMAGGALAAGSVAVLGAWSQASPALRPVWTGLHLGLIALGLVWLATGRQPDWMKRDSAVPVRVVKRRGRLVRAGMAGLAWVAWPCGALQAALLLSALASSAPGGALVMAAFAVGSMPGLTVMPWALARWRSLQARPGQPANRAGLGFRLAGAGLVSSSGWALSQGVWERFAGWCFS